MECAPASLRAGLRAEYERRVQLVRQSKRASAEPEGLYKKGWA
jgi:hypothetical protein